jgi:hypothetical protein
VESANTRTGPVYSASNRSPTWDSVTGSPSAPLPPALVNTQVVMIPVSGSTAVWVLNPS